MIAAKACPDIIPFMQALVLLQNAQNQLPEPVALALAVAAGVSVLALIGSILLARHMRRIADREPRADASDDDQSK